MVYIIQIYLNMIKNDKYSTVQYFNCNNANSFNTGIHKIQN